MQEPVESNFIRKHALELTAKGVERPAARLFSNPAGDFGSMVNERVIETNMVKMYLLYAMSKSVCVFQIISPESDLFVTIFHSENAKRGTICYFFSAGTIFSPRVHLRWIPPVSIDILGVNPKTYVGL